jgi:two-component system cell cycle response regulator
VRLTGTRQFDANLTMCPPPKDRKPPLKDPPADGEDATQVGTVDRALLRAHSQRDRAYLIVLAGENIGQMFPVRDTETVIGRATDAAVRLKDDGVSRKHARIIHDNNAISVEDLNSANGTLVNGHRIQHAALQDGDKIQVGSTTILKFTYADRLEEAFQQKMYEAALHDGLTKAYTKRYFLDRLPTEIAYARRHAAPLSLLMLDVDHFKVVNDTHGHPAGDYVLVTLSQLIASALRTEDIFARFGGEEFLILCRGVALDNAALVAERIRLRIEAAAFNYQDTKIAVTVSIGVASYFDQPDPGTQLIADADAALYQAKRAGRNRVLRSSRVP